MDDYSEVSVTLYGVAKSGRFGEGLEERVTTYRKATGCLSLRQCDSIRLNECFPFLSTSDPVVELVDQSGLPQFSLAVALLTPARRRISE